jgi:hypothetical protein
MKSRLCGQAGFIWVRFEAPNFYSLAVVAVVCPCVCSVHRLSFNSASRNRRLRLGYTSHSRCRWMSSLLVTRP